MDSRNRNSRQRPPCLLSLLPYLLSLFLFLPGCAPLPPGLPGPWKYKEETTSLQTGLTPSQEAERIRGFGEGVQAALKAYEEQYLDNDFPYYNWSFPLVQRVWIPPSIEGGVFIPGHMDYVIIKPGAWKREFAAPISGRRGLSEERPYILERPPGGAEIESKPSEPEISSSPQGPEIVPFPPEEEKGPPAVEVVPPGETIPPGPEIEFEREGESQGEKSALRHPQPANPARDRTNPAGPWPANPAGPWQELLPPEGVSFSTR